MGRLKKISSQHMPKKHHQQTNGVKCKSTNQNFKKSIVKKTKDLGSWGDGSGMLAF